MTCSRCASLIVGEHLVNPVAGSSGGFPCWRCLNCGAIVDKVISMNRMASPLIKKPGSPRHQTALAVDSGRRLLAVARPRR